MHIEVNAWGEAYVKPYVESAGCATAGIASGIALETLSEDEMRTKYAGNKAFVIPYHGDVATKKRKTRKKSAKRRVR